MAAPYRSDKVWPWENSMSPGTPRLGSCRLLPVNALCAFSAAAICAASWRFMKSCILARGARVAPGRRRCRGLPGRMVCGRLGGARALSSGTPAASATPTPPGCPPSPRRDSGHATVPWARARLHRLAASRRLVAKPLLHPIADTHAGLVLVLVSGEADALTSAASPWRRCTREREERETDHGVSRALTARAHGKRRARRVAEQALGPCMAEQRRNSGRKP